MTNGKIKCEEAEEANEKKKKVNTIRLNFPRVIRLRKQNQGV